VVFTRYGCALVERDFQHFPLSVLDPILGTDHQPFIAFGRDEKCTFPLVLLERKLSALIGYRGLKSTERGVVLSQVAPIKELLLVVKGVDNRGLRHRFLGGDVEDFAPQRAGGREVKDCLLSFVLRRRF